jgi:hypothetical protein
MPNYTYTYDTESQVLKGVLTVSKESGGDIVFIVDADPNTNNSEHEIAFPALQDPNNVAIFADLLYQNSNNAFLNFITLLTNPPV